MKMTVLEMVQDIMSDGDSDEVTSISDTVEAGQIAGILRTIFNQAVTNEIIPEYREIRQLGTVSLVTYPGALNYLELPSNVSEMTWFQYDWIKVGDTQHAFTEICYQDPRTFMATAAKNASDNTTNYIQVADPTSGLTYYVMRDQPPRNWTTFDDHFIALDGFDITVDSAQVLGTKTIAEVQLIPTWTMDDDFIPNMDDNMFSYLLAEAKSTYYYALKTQANPKVEKQSREQRIRLQSHKYRTDAAQKDHTGSTGPNFGRT